MIGHDSELETSKIVAFENIKDYIDSCIPPDNSRSIQEHDDPLHSKSNPKPKKRKSEGACSKGGKKTFFEKEEKAEELVQKVQKSNNLQILKLNCHIDDLLDSKSLSVNSKLIEIQTLCKLLADTSQDFANQKAHATHLLKLIIQQNICLRAESRNLVLDFDSCRLGKQGPLEWVIGNEQHKLKESIRQIEEQRAKNKRVSNPVKDLLCNRQLKKLHKQVQSIEKQKPQYKELYKRRQAELKSLWKPGSFVFEKYQIMQVLNCSQWQTYKAFDHKSLQLIVMRRYPFHVLGLSHDTAHQLYQDLKLIHFDSSSFLSSHIETLIQGDRSVVNIQEYLKGPDLQTLLKQHQLLTEKEVKTIVKSVVTALSKIAGVGRYHGRLTPKKIIFGQKDIKVADYYLNDRLAKHYIPKQDLKYLPPEFYSGLRSPDKFDVWSLGVITFQMMYGFSPLTNAEKGIQSALGEEIQFPPKPSSSHELRDLIRGCLRSNAAERLSMQTLQKNSFFIKK